MKLTKKNIKALEKLGWSVKTTDDGYCLENYSPCGGHMVIEAKSKEDIIQYCEYYDAEEEFNCWWGAKRGEPSTPSELWKDCLEKGKMYDAVKEALQ